MIILAKKKRKHKATKSKKKKVVVHELTPEEIAANERRHLWETLGIPIPSKKAPPLGMRAIKTTLVVTLITLVYEILGRFWPSRETGMLLAIIAAIVAMQDTVEHSLQSGIVRILATILGGVFGVLLIIIIFCFPESWHPVLRYMAIPIGTISCIYIENWLNFQTGIVLSVFVLIAILATDNSFRIDGALMYAMNRVVDTLIGIILSIIVNVTIRPPKWE